MTIERCSGLSANTVYRWLNFNERLQYFEVADWSPKNQQDYLDRIPLFVPTIRHLSLSITCISERFFITTFRLPTGQSRMNSKLDQTHPLETFELTSYYNAISLPNSFRIQPAMAYMTIATGLHNLRTFRIDDSLGWRSGYENKMVLAAIYQSLEVYAQIRGDTRRIRVSGVKQISNHTSSTRVSHPRYPKII